MSLIDESEKAPAPLWEYVPIADYALPPEPVAHTVKKGITHFRSIFRRGESEETTPLKNMDDLKKLPELDLERIAPAPDWTAAAESLTVRLSDWLSAENPVNPVIILVAPPFSRSAEILTAWSNRQGWRRLTTPSVEQILAGDEKWIAAQIQDGKPWVYPFLESAYLRHAQGIGLIGRFLDRAGSGDLGRGVIGCDSWTWSFLRQVRRGRRPTAIVLQSFDHRRLARLFQQLASADGRPMLCCQSDNGRCVLPSPENEEASGEMSDYLQCLAAYSRGILGVAWEIWRECLQIEPDDSAAEESKKRESRSLRQTFWVAPWNDFKQPALPSDAGHDESVVLHTILLHNGLPLELLQMLLPLAPNQVLETLLRLEDVGLVSLSEGIWRCVPAGYPAVRRFLKNLGYLVDAF